MGSLNNSCSSTNFKLRKHSQMERRPLMLKDFLIDDSNSCSSSGFKSFPRKTCHPSIRTLIEIDLNARNASSGNARNASSGNARNLLLRNRLKAASATISAFQAMINAVKNIPFTAVKPPSILPRSLSRRLSKKSISDKTENKENEAKITVTVKDIMRWRSFRDRIEERSPPSDLASPPHHCNTTTTTTTSRSTTTTPCSSNGSSWCDSDFTSEYLPSWDGNSLAAEKSENEVQLGKKIYSPCVGGDCTETTKETATSHSSLGPKEEEIQHHSHSPVSVIDFEFEEDEESTSSFDQSLAAVNRTKQTLMQNIRRFESLAKLNSVNLEKWMSMEEFPSSEEVDEEGGGKETNTIYQEEECDGDDDDNELNQEEKKAWKLLNHVKHSKKMIVNEDNLDQLLLDFVREEMKTTSDGEMFNAAKAWINGEASQCFEWEAEHKREAFVRDMDDKGRWSELGKEQEEVALSIESRVLGRLLDELLLDLISC